MLTVALSVTRHTSLRLEELAGAATAVAGALLFFGAGLPLGRRGSQALCGLLFATAGVLWVIAIRWGPGGI